MRKVFSSNDVSEATLVQDALVRHGIEVTVANEHSGTRAVPAFRPPAEIWVKQYSDAGASALRRDDASSEGR